MKLTNKIIENYDSEGKNRDLSDSEVTGLTVRVSKNNNKTYYFFYKNAEGKRRKYRIAKCSQIGIAVARKKATVLRGLVVTGGDPQAERATTRTENKKAITLEQFLNDHYFPYIERPATEHKRADKTKTILLACFKQKDNCKVSQKGKRKDEESRYINLYRKKLNKLKKKHFEQWYDDEINRGLSASTVNRSFATIRATLNYAVKENLITENPCLGIKLLKAKKGVVRYLLEDERIKLFNALDEMKGDIPVIIKLLYYTGCRPVEIFTLQWHSVNLAQKHITIQAEYSKNGKVRHPPLNEQACKLLAQRHGDTGYLFINQNTGRHVTSINREWKRLMRKLEIENLRLYDLRHNYASQLVMKGIDLFTVSELLGHSDVSITTVYAHLSPKHKLEAVNLLE